MRPYDLALLVAVRGLAVLLTEPPREWWRKLLPLAGLLPVVLYLYWVFFRSGTFSVFSDAAYVFPPWRDFLPALGPAVVLAATAAWAPRSGAEAPRFTLHLACWAALCLLLIVLRPVTFSLQFLVGAGLPLLCLGALGLCRLRPVATTLAALALSSTAVIATHFLFAANPAWYVPSSRLSAGYALRGHCRPGDVVLAPPDIGAVRDGPLRVQRVRFPSGGAGRGGPGGGPQHVLRPGAARVAGRAAGAALRHARGLARRRGGNANGVAWGSHGFPARGWRGSARCGCGVRTRGPWTLRRARSPE